MSEQSTPAIAAQQAETHDAPEFRLIPLTRGEFAIVDPEDYEWLSQFKWQLLVGKYEMRYAVRNIPNPGNHAKRKQARMHRVIIDAPDDMEVDHIDGNGLNNRRSNLRLCTSLQNMHNRRKRMAAHSKYKGVTLHKRSQRWQVAIRINGVKSYLGYYSSDADAARAYDVAAIKHFGEFACTNFPVEDYQ